MPPAAGAADWPPRADRDVVLDPGQHGLHPPLRHLHLAATAAGIALDDPAGQERPSYHDFANVTFTIGMSYQVSDTTLRNTRLRRSVLAYATLPYRFGVVIVAGTINLTSGLVR